MTETFLGYPPSLINFVAARAAPGAARPIRHRAGPLRTHERVQKAYLRMHVIFFAEPHRRIGGGVEPVE